MKKLFLLLLLGFFLMGCTATIRESGFWSHHTHYRNWDHMKYSWHGYKHPKARDYKKSKNQHWWGLKYPKRHHRR